MMKERCRGKQSISVPSWASLILSIMLQDKLLMAIIIIMAFAMANETKDTYHVHTSCSERGDTHWTMAKPQKLRSWLGSVVPGM